MHPPGLLEQDTSILGNDVVALQHVFKDRCARAVGVLALGHLRQLLRVAEENEVPGGEPGGDHARQRQLTCFVDEQEVELPLVLGASKQPGRAGD